MRIVCFKSVLYFFLLPFLLMSCQEDPDSILGGNYLPSDDVKGFYQDTAFHLISYTISEDSIISQNKEDFLFGATFDPVFGQTSYNFVTQLNYQKSSSIHEDLGENYEVDSVILELAYASYFPYKKETMEGRPITFDLYELSENVNPGSTTAESYRSFSEIGYNSTPLQSGIQFVPRPFDSILDSNSSSYTIRPLKIRLDKSVGDKLISNSRDSSTFRNDFKGLYFKVHEVNDPSRSAAVTMSNSFYDGAKITVYHDGNKEENINSYRVFTLGPPNFFQVLRNRELSSDENLKRQLAGDTALGQQRLYLEGCAGTRIRFKIPNLKEVFPNPIIINRASLILTEVKDPAPDLSEIPVPRRLRCFISNPNKTITYLPDYYVNPGGTYNSSKGQYEIVLTRYLQQVLTNDSELSFIEITVQESEQLGSPVHAVFYGPDDKSISPLKLEVLYTAFPQPQQ